MTVTLRLALVLTLILTGGLTVHAERNTGATLRDLNEFSLKQYDLARMWSVQVETDISYGGLAEITAYVSPSRSTTLYHVAKGEELLATFSELDLDAFGRKLGPDGAKTKAEKELAALQQADPELKAEVVKRVVPQVTLYCMAESGLVHALDAETGRTLWVRPFGSPNNPAYSPGVNDKYIAIANGSTVFVADSQTGESIYETKLASLPGAGPAVSDQVVHIPLADGFVESHYLRKPDERLTQPIYRFRSIGQLDVQPVISGGTIAWPSMRGYMYVGDANQNNIRYRLECRDEIRCKPAFGTGNRILVGSVDGNLYCLQERSGSLEWRFTSGEPIIEAPVVVGNEVFVCNEYGGVFSIDLASGQERWWAPSVTRVVGVSPTRIYGLGALGRVYILDRSTGGLVGTIPLVDDKISFVNTFTDRIYLATERGRVIALRETNAVYPVIHDSDAVAAPHTPQTQPGTNPQTPATPAMPSSDPFATPSGMDPFATPAAADPFGTAPPAGGSMPAADPFAAPSSDPFGAAPASDPFATPPAGGTTPNPTVPNDPFAN